MRYEIKYDKPGRLRVRFGRNAFSAEQGYGIEQLLMSDISIFSAETTPINGGLLICYEHSSREHVLTLIGKLDKQNLPLSQPQETQIMRKRREALTRETAYKAGKHVVMEYLLPAPIRAVISTFDGIRKWKKEYDELLIPPVSANIPATLPVKAEVFGSSPANAVIICLPAFTQLQNGKNL